MREFLLSHGKTRDFPEREIRARDMHMGYMFYLLLFKK